MTITALTRALQAMTEVHIPIAAIVLVALLGIVEVALLIIALIHLLRHPHPRLLPLWAWLVVILFFSLIGPILYFALGRGQEEPDYAPPPDAEYGAGESRRTIRAVDLLYGSGDAPGRQDPPAADSSVTTRTDDGDASEGGSPETPDQRP